MRYWVSVIILNYNSADLTIECIESLLKLNLMKINIIIVDNASTDDSMKKIKDKFINVNNIYYIQNKKNLGYAKGNNVGLDFINKNMEITTDFVAILNPDVIINDASIFKVLPEYLINDNEIGAITTKTILNNELLEPNNCAWRFLSKVNMFFGGTIFNRLISKKNIYYEKMDKECFKVDVIQGCFFIIKKDLFNEIKGFDENTFLYCEESILAKKLHFYNKRNAVITNKFIYHNHKSKNKNLQKYDNKVFHLKCFMDSRKYYIKNYSGESILFKSISRIFLTINYYIKKFYFKVVWSFKNE